MVLGADGAPLDGIYPREKMIDWLPHHAQSLMLLALFPLLLIVCVEDFKRTNLKELKGVILCINSIVVLGWVMEVNQEHLWSLFFVHLFFGLFWLGIGWVLFSESLWGGSDGKILFAIGLHLGSYSFAFVSWLIVLTLIFRNRPARSYYLPMVIASWIGATASIEVAMLVINNLR